MNLERIVRGHDGLIREIYDALNELREPPKEPPLKIKVFGPRAQLL
jgi:hypothetical protein